MVVRQLNNGRFWAVDVSGANSADVEVIMFPKKSRLVVRANGATIVIENLSEKELKELNHE